MKEGFKTEHEWTSVQTDKTDVNTGEWLGIQLYGVDSVAYSVARFLRFYWMSWKSSCFSSEGSRVPAVTRLTDRPKELFLSFPLADWLEETSQEL